MTEQEINNDCFGTFIRASDRESDPVGRLDGIWGFWDETWTYWYGGFKNEAQAREKLEEYCRIYL